MVAVGSGRGKCLAGSAGVVLVRPSGGGSKIEKFYETKKPKSTLLTDNTRELITTKQTKPKLVSSAALNPI